MFKPVNIVLEADLADTETLELDEKYDPFRTAKDGHIWLNKTQDARYTAPDDFTLAIDADGTVIITWAHADTQLDNDVVLLGLAYIDQLTGSSLAVTGGGGTFDSAGIGDPSDPAWSGSGDATLVSVAKLQGTNLLSGLPVEVMGALPRKTAVPVIDTAVYVAGDVLFTTTAVLDFASAADRGTLLTSLALLDKQGKAISTTQIDLYFMADNTTLGAVNGAPTLTTANFLTKVLHRVRIEPTDWSPSVNGAKIADLGNISKLLIPAPGTTTVYVAAVLVAGPPAAAWALGDLVLALEGQG